MITLENADLWDRYTKSHKDAKPFRNSGFPHFQSVELLLPSSTRGRFVYRPHATGTVTSTPFSITTPSTTSAAATPPPGAFPPIPTISVPVDSVPQQLGTSRLSLLEITHALNSPQETTPQLPDPNAIPPSTPSSCLSAPSSSSSAITSISQISQSKRKAESVIGSEGGYKRPRSKVEVEQERNNIFAGVTSKLDNLTTAVAAPLPMPPRPPPATNPLVDAAMDCINSMPDLTTDDRLDIGDYFLEASIDEVNIFLKHQEPAKEAWVQCRLAKCRERR
ncbi:hypothetical protein EDD15DRAFT_2377330 [Pisolithus albus]|nr:hypothetical protein EDD15DRAFT_2377330 [Pisolithus albus]